MTTLQQFLLVGAGGFAGAGARFLMSEGVQRLSGTLSFPYGTLSVNALGCFAFGLLAGLTQTRGLLSEPARITVMVGVLGGFTTFSAFSFQTFELLRDGALVRAAMNVVASVVVCIVLVWVGYTIGNR